MPRLQWRESSRAREFVRSLGLQSGAEFRKWARGDLLDLPARPDHMPTNPQRTHADIGWKGWGDFLGNGEPPEPQGKRFRKPAMPFEEAREFARLLGLRSRTEWQAWSRGDRQDLPPRPPDIPGKPHVRYEEFISWADFLGANRDARGREPDARGP